MIEPYESDACCSLTIHLTVSEVRPPEDLAGYQMKGDPL